MEEKERKKIIEEMIEHFRKHSKTCMKEVLEIFASKNIPLPVMYYILTSLTSKMEKVDPKLKHSRMMADRIMDEIKKQIAPLPEVRLVALARQMNKDWLKGKKASIWACSMKKTRDDIRTKCEECGGVCYRSRDPDKDLMEKGAKNICLKCVMTDPKYSKDLNKEQRDIMEKGV